MFLEDFRRHGVVNLDMRIRRISAFSGVPSRAVTYDAAAGLWQVGLMLAAARPRYLAGTGGGITDMNRRAEASEAA